MGFSSTHVKKIISLFNLSNFFEYISCFKDYILLPIFVLHNTTNIPINAFTFEGKKSHNH